MKQMIEQNMIMLVGEVLHQHIKNMIESNVLVYRYLTHVLKLSKLLCSIWKRNTKLKEI